ncbi:hypothetical protein [Nocardia sp. NPDC050717]
MTSALPDRSTRRRYPAPLTRTTFTRGTVVDRLIAVPLGRIG